MAIVHAETKSLRFESLEPKRMMAGDVVIGVNGGNLIMTGDGADNQIAISSAGPSGAVAVVGLNDTAVNWGGLIHAPGEPAVVSGVVGDVVASLSSGNDLVMIDKLAVRGRLIVDAGDGNDTVVASRLSAGRGLVVNGGAGDDSLAVRASQIRGGAALVGGEGNDTMVVQQTVVGRSLAVAGGEGDDTVVVHQSRATRARITTGVGNDALHLVDSAFGQIGAQMGPGQDRLALGGVNVPGRATFDGGIGDDLLQDLGRNHIARGRVVRFA